MGSARAIPLPAEDRAILELESDRVAGHTCKVALLEGPPLEAEEVRGRLRERLEGDSLLRRRLGGSETEPVWIEGSDLDLDRHVVASGGEPLPADRLEPLIAELFSERLDRSRPLWRIDLAALAEGGTALIWRTHHALADGTTAMRLAREVLWDEGLAPRAKRPHHPAEQERRRLHLGSFLRREVGMAGGSPFDGEIGTERSIAFAEAPLGELHDAAKSLAGATLNDAVIVAVAGGLRGWMASHELEPGRLRIKIPVSLHSEGADAGNRDSFFSLPIDLSEPDPVTALAAVRSETTARKRGHDAKEWEALHGALAAHSARLEGLLRRVQRNPRTFAVCVSNVPGPRGEPALLDRRVRSIHSIAEIGERHALRVAVVSAAGTLGFGFCADPAIVPDVEGIARGAEAAAAQLVAASA